MTIQFRTLEDGSICCSSLNAAGQRIAPEHPCDRCKAHFAALETTAPPDPYAKPLAALRAASSTPESRFEDAYKADRRRALAADTVAHEARFETPRLTSELASYAPPDGYKIALQRAQR